MGESKEEMKSESKEEDIIDASDLVDRFAVYCTSDEFSKDLRDWERENCSAFRGCDLSLEQPLEFTKLHEEYIGVMEGLMENYCRDEGLSIEELFKAVAEVVDDSGVAEFLPQVLLNTEYMHFARQMKSAAEIDEDREKAMEAGTSGGRGRHMNLSGVYKRSPKYKFDSKGFDMFLSSVGCPWVFRKLMIKSASNITDVFLTHADGELNFKYKMSFFGSRETVYLLDGVKRDVLNLWNVPRPQTCFEEDDGVTIVIRPHPALGEGGFTEHKFTKEVDEEGDSILRWTQSLRDPSKDLSLDCQFVFAEE